jgi:electron transport protein HydN
MNRFIDVKPSRCIGCRTCEIACALSHAEPGIEPSITPADGDDVLACLGRAPRLEVIKAENVCMPVTCHHCDDAPCAGACPTGAISFVENTVQVDQNRCIGCKSCMIVCPYGMIEVVAVPVSRPCAGVRVAMGSKGRARKCDLCIDRPAGPACVAACPTSALWIAGEDEVRALMLRRREAAMAEAVANEARPQALG